MQALAEQFQTFLGYPGPVGEVDALQMALRTVLISAFTLLLIRLGSPRFLSQATAIDVIVGIMLGSLMSRAINGSAPLYPTLLAGLLLIGLHWSFVALTVRLRWLGPLVKGSPVLLVRDGQIERQGMRRAGLSDRDLAEALRLRGVASPGAGVKFAYLERNGAISVVLAHQPRVLDVRALEGVQTIRIELD